MFIACEMHNIRGPIPLNYHGNVPKWTLWRHHCYEKIKPLQEATETTATGRSIAIYPIATTSGPPVTGYLRPIFPFLISQYTNEFIHLKCCYESMTCHVFLYLTFSVEY